MQRLAVIGGGAWGTGLAQALVRAGREVTLWVRERAVAQEIAETNENRSFLPEVPLSPEIWATADLAEAVDGAEALLLAVPAQYLRQTARTLQAHASPETPLVICAKGIEDGTLALMSEVLEAELPGWPVAVLSGPTFAGRSRAESRRRSRWPRAIPLWATGWPRRSAAGPSGPTCPTTWWARRSAARSRTWSRSPAASSTAATWARTRAPP